MCDLITENQFANTMIEKTLLTEAIEKIHKEFKARIPRATGGMQDSLETIVTSRHAVLLGDEYIEALETGRSPRKASKDSGFAARLFEWMKAVGFPDASMVKAKQLAWYINKYGTKAYREGGKTGIISDFNIDIHINKLADKLGTKYTNIIAQGIARRNINVKTK